MKRVSEPGDVGKPGCKSAAKPKAKSKKGSGKGRARAVNEV